MKKIKMKGIVLLSIFVMFLSVVSIALIGNTKAEEIYVEPGSGTLKEAVESAKDGAVLKLKAGSYNAGADEKSVTIDKEITIEGAGNTFNSKNPTIINVPLIIKSNKKVVLDNFSCSIQQVENDFIFFNVDTQNADLEIKRVRLSGILRSDSDTKKYPRHEATIVNVTSNAAGSKININDSGLLKPGVHYGIAVRTGNTNITLDNCSVSGRTAILFENGENNIFNVENGSTIEGPSVHYEDNEVIKIDKQTKLNFNVSDSKILSVIPSGNRDADVNNTTLFSFGNGDKKSTGVKIDIQNSSLVDNYYEEQYNNPSYNNSIIAFGTDNTEEDGNIVKFDNKSKMYASIVNSGQNELERKELTTSRRYRSVPGKAVINIYDKDGNSEVKLYEANSSIDDTLNNESYIQKEGYAFKGWFKDPAYTEEYVKEGDNYPQTKADTTLDLYPKFNKILNVTIKGVPTGTGDTTQNNVYQVEEGTKLSEAQENQQIKQDLEKIRDKEKTQEFKGFVIYNSHGSTTYSDIDSLMNSLEMTESCEIEAIHKVKVTINGFDFYINSGQKLTDIKDVSTTDSKIDYKTAKMTGSNEREFSRFVKDSNVTVTEEEGITSNVVLSSKFLQKVTVKNVPSEDGSVSDKSYSLEEGQKLNSNEAIKNALDSIKPDIEGRTWNRYVDEIGSKIDVESYTINKDLTISSVYTIKVKFDVKDESIEYTLDVGQSLSDLKDETNIKKNLEKVADNIPNNTSFDGFVISNDKDSTNKHFDLTKETTKEALEDLVLAEKLEYNTTIYARHNVKVTIGSAEFELESGETLKSGILDKPNNEEKIAQYKAAKLNGKDEERFYKFVDEDDKDFTEEQEITKNMTLSPKYFVFVTIKDERDNIGGRYKLEENTDKGKTLDDLIDGEDAYTKLKYDIVDENNVTGRNLHFDKIVKIADDGKESDFNLDTKIKEDITIKGIYHYDVSIVENYDEPDSSKDNSHVKGLKAYEGKTLENTDASTEIKAALNALKESATTNDKKRVFDTFIETNTGIEYDTDALLDKVFNYHIFINAKVSYKVEIGEVSDYIKEGHKIGESGILTKEIERLKSITNKHLNKFVVNTKDVSIDTILDTVIDEYTEIEPKYEVNITIGENQYTINEGGTLNDLVDQKTAIEADLDKLRTDIENKGFHFRGYNVGKDITEAMKHVFNNDDEITGAYDVRITIGSNSFDLDEERTLGALKAKEGYDTAVQSDKRELLGFMDGDTRIDINNNKYLFVKNTTLTPIYGIKVTVKDNKGYSKEYTLEEDQALDDVIGESVTDLTKEDKILVGFVDNKNKGNSIVDSKGKVLTNVELDDTYPEKTMTIIATYQIKVTISDYKGNKITEVLLDEGQNLDSDPSWKTALEELAINKTYAGLYDGSDKVKTDTALTKNTTYTAKYTVDIKIKDTKNTEKGTITIFEGDSLSKATGGEKDELDSILSEENLVESSINTSQVFMEDAEITAKYYKTVTIGEDSFKIEEGKTLQSLIDSKELDSIMNPEGKHFAKFIKESKEFDPETIINEDINLNIIYKIIIEVQTGENSKSYEFILEDALADGVDLDTIDNQVEKHENFLRFETESGDKIEDTTPKFKKDTTIVQKYEIEINADGYSKKLESGQNLSNLGEEALKALKINTEGRKFSRFVDQNGKTIKEDEPLYENTTVIPKFNIKITVFRKDDEGKEIEDDTFEFELGEDLPIAGITEEENTKLQKWIDEIVKKLAEEGKENYVFTKFIDEKGNEIDLNNTIFSEDTRLEAIFELKKEETPINPTQPETNENNNGNNNSYPVKEKAPNTAVKNQEIELKGIIYSILTILTFAGSGVIGYRKISLKNDK